MSLSSNMRSMSLAFLETDGRADRSAPSRFRPDQPQCREDFEIAIICALPLEFDAVSLLFDEYYDTHGDQFGRAVGDKNHYVTGRIGAHDVVLTLLASMGKIQAATTGAHIGASFPNLKLVLLVGICGGVPVLKGGTELLLGDVVVSEAVVQYDFGRQYPDAFLLKGTTQGNLNRSSADIDGLLVTLHTQLGLERLQQRTTCFLNNLQTSASTKSDTDRYLNPGAAEDVLFAPENRHRHLNCTGSCICGQWGKPSDPVCETARDSSCAQLGCADAVPRKRIQLRLALERGRPDTKLQEPLIFLGRIASGDTIMKSGLTRDKLAKELDIIAFEMEGSGIWCEHPCIVVKGVCDYADSHKSKRWQNFAAATAASATKALLERWPRTDKRSTSRLLRTSHPNNHETTSISSAWRWASPEQHWRNLLVSPALIHLPRTLQNYLTTSPYSGFLSTQWKAAVSQFIRTRPEVPIWLSNTSLYKSWSKGIGRALCYEVSEADPGMTDAIPEEYDESLLAFLGEMEEYEDTKNGTKVKLRPANLERLYLFYSATDQTHPMGHVYDLSPVQNFLWSLISQVLLWRFESMSLLLSWLGVLDPEGPSLRQVPDPDRLQTFLRSLLELSETTVVVTLCHAERLSEQLHFPVIQFVAEMCQGVTRLQVPVFLVMSVSAGTAMLSLPGSFLRLSRDTERNECLHDFRFDGQFLRRDEVSAADAGTNDWIWSHPAFLEWESRSSGVLWVEGKAGSGKSVLAKTIQSRLSQARPSPLRGNSLPPVSDWFYSSRHGDLTKSHTAFLRSILGQMLEQNKNSFFSYSSAFRQKRQDNDSWGLEDYESILKSLATRGDPAVCIVDAMDESETGDDGCELRTRIISLIARLVQAPGSRMRFIVLSRYTADIDQAMRRSWKNDDLLAHIILEQENRADIAQIVENGLIVVKRALSDFDSEDEDPLYTSPKLQASWCAELQALERIQQYLINHAEGVILWVKLALQTVIDRVRRGNQTLREVEKDIKSLSKDLVAFYKCILDDLILRYPPEELERSRQCLMWVAGVSAVRPLALDELEEALCIPQAIGPSLISDRDPIADSPLRIRARSWIGFYRQLRMRCGPFIEVLIPANPGSTPGFRNNTAIHPRFTVQLLHRTVKDFLNDPTNAGPLHFTDQEAEKLLQRSLSTYIQLVLPIGTTHYCPVPAKANATLQTTIEAMCQYLNGKDLLELVLTTLSEEEVLPHLMLFENSVNPPLMEQRTTRPWNDSLQAIGKAYFSYGCRKGLTTAIANLLSITSILLLNWPTLLRYGILVTAIRYVTWGMSDEIPEEARKARRMLRAFQLRDMSLVWDCQGLGAPPTATVTLPTIKDFRDVIDSFEASHGGKLDNRKVPNTPNLEDGHSPRWLSRTPSPEFAAYSRGIHLDQDPIRLTLQ